MALTPPQRVEFLRLEASCWRDEIIRRDNGTWPYYTADTTTYVDGDVYTRQYDNMLWVWKDRQWTGPFADLDTAMVAARMLL